MRSRPPPSALLSRQQLVSLYQSFRVSPVELTDGRGGRRGWARSYFTVYDYENTWPSIIIQYSLIAKGGGRGKARPQDSLVPYKSFNTLRLPLIHIWGREEGKAYSRPWETAKFIRFWLCVCGCRWNAKCQQQQKIFTCKGTLRQVFILSVWGSEPPPPHTVYKFTVYLFTHEGGRVEPERGLEGQEFSKLGRKYQHDWQYLQSINSD